MFMKLANPYQVSHLNNKICSIDFFSNENEAYFERSMSILVLLKCMSMVSASQHFFLC